MEIIGTEGLTKIYGKTVAVDKISIKVNKGEIYGFLGLNGAGKTTLIRTLLRMVKPSSGKIRLFGQELSTDFNGWNDIGYMVETSNSYPHLTVYDNLKVFYNLRNLTDPSIIDLTIENLKLTKY